MQTIQSDDYVEIAEGIYWVGFADQNAGFHCNPYLIVDNDQAILIDGGSRNDFSTVMLKIMRTGANPNNIIRLIYQHYDPDLCGNIPHLEALIDNQELKIISHRDNNIFINYYSNKSPKLCIEKMDFTFQFASGRRLQFIRTPYSHTSGSFVTYDTKSKVLFSSDLFGGYDDKWRFYTHISSVCSNCGQSGTCAVSSGVCQILNILDFHKRVMTSAKALRYALEQIEKLDISIIAPQHGSILDTAIAQKIVIERLKALDNVGFDYFIEESGL